MAVDYVRASTQYHLLRNLHPRIAGQYGFTISVWFRPDDTTSSATVSLSTDGGTARHQLTTSTSVTMASVDSGGTVGSATSGSAPTVGAWNHAFGRVSGAASRVVVLNGGTAASNTTSIASATHDRLVIGARISAGAFGASFDGAIAHVAVWSVPLGVSEGALLARGASPLSIRPESLIYYFPLDLGSGFVRDVVSGSVAAAAGAPTVVPYDGPMIRPPQRSARIIQFTPPAAGGGSFIPSWAIAARGQIHGAGRGH